MAGPRVFYAFYLLKKRTLSAPPAFTIVEDTPEPYAASLLPLAAELGVEASDPAALLRQSKLVAKGLLHGSAPLAELLAASQSAMELNAGFEEEGYVNDLLAARFIPVAAAKSLPASMAKWSRLEQHVALARSPGGLLTRGLAKIGHAELTIACEPGLEAAAVVALRSIVRELFQTQKPLHEGEKRTVAAGALSLAVHARAPRAEPLALHDAHMTALRQRLGDFGFEPVALLEVALLDTAGDESTASILASVPADARPELRAEAAPPPLAVAAKEKKKKETKDKKEKKSKPEPPAELVARELGPPRWPSAKDVPDFAKLFRSSAERVGAIPLASGELVASDPLLELDVEPFPFEVAPAIYPVFVARKGDRNAAAAILFSDETPAKWERSWSYSVDSGTGGFCDLGLARAIVAKEDAHEKLNGKLEKALAKSPHAIVPVKLGKSESGELAAFESGEGDGTYVSYIARDKKGGLVAVVTGFGLVEGDEARETDEDASTVAQERAEEARQREAARRRPALALSDFVPALNVELRVGGDFSEVARLLAADASLERDGSRASGRDAVVKALKALEGELVLEGEPALPEPFVVESRFVWKKKATGGTLRLRITPEGKIREILLLGGLTI